MIPTSLQKIGQTANPVEKGPFQKPSLLSRVGKGLIAFGSGRSSSEIDMIRANRDLMQQQVEAGETEQLRNQQIEMLRGVAFSDHPDADKALNRLFQLDPQSAEQVFKGIGAMEQYQREDAARRAAEIRNTPPELREQVIRRQAEELRAQGRDPRDTESLLGMAPEQQDSALRVIEAAALSAKDRMDAERGLNVPAGQREFESLIEGFTPDEQARARRIKAGLVQRAGTKSLRQMIAEDPVLAEALARVEAEAAAEKEGAKGEARRSQELISVGLRQADATAVIRRGLELLDIIDTGRPEAIALAAKNLFGVAGADETELQANLGKAILAQLRQVFGAQFTEREGSRLEGIEANFGKSTAGNRRLLEQTLKDMERDARRGIDAARRNEDEFSVREIENALKFRLTPEDDDGVQEEAQETETDEVTATGPNGEKAVLRDGKWVIL